MAPPPTCRPRRRGCLPSVRARAEPTTQTYARTPQQNSFRGGLMSEWNFMDFARKGNLLRTVREQSNQMFALASERGAWENPTGAGHWQVRDVVGHLVDTTEGYFTGWDAAHGKGTAPDALGVRGMDKHVDEGALALRSVPQDQLLARLDKDRAQ